MTCRTWTVLLLLIPASALRAADPYSVKAADATPPPADLKEAVRNLLGEHCVQFYSVKGDLIAELWLRKEVPVKATEAQVKNGLTYREVPQTTLMGAIRFARQVTDYRKQKIPEGTYTLRLAYQPMDGDHQGTAPHNEFLLLSPAGDDGDPKTMTPKALQELSAKTTGGHPGVLLLFPGKGAEAMPKLVSKGKGTWAVLFQIDAKAGDMKATLPMALTLVGASPAA